MKAQEELLLEMKDLRKRLKEAEETLRDLRVKTDRSNLYNPNDFDLSNLCRPDLSMS